MKLLFLRLLMLITCLTALWGCADAGPSSQVSGNVKTRLPWPQADGSYALQVFELTGISSLYDLAGQFAQFYMSPGIEHGRLIGASPKARFIKTKGLFVAEDGLSLQLATVYAHMQRLAALDKDLGVGDVNKWPRDVGVSVRLTGDVRNNAFYDGDTDSMLFVPYAGAELPLAVNAGILGHEHFHSLFYKIVTLPLNKAGQNPGNISASAHSQADFYRLMKLPAVKTENIAASANQEQAAYHFLLMKGLNEGLADFWGWLYTGDPDFIGYSLPTQIAARSLRAQDFDQPYELSSPSGLRRTISIFSADNSHLSSNINNYAYTIGTQFSRILKIFADNYAQERQLSGDEARRAVAQIILHTLPSFRDDLLQIKSTDYYEPSHFFSTLLTQVDKVHQSECQIISDVMNKNNTDGKWAYLCERQGSAAVWSLTKKEISDAKSQVPAVKPLQKLSPSQGAG